jgi:hypothetical protein
MASSTYKLTELCDYLTDSDANQQMLASSVYTDPDTKEQSPMDDEKKQLLIFEIYDNLDQLGKHLVKIQTSMRQKFKFTKKQVDEYFVDEE